MPPYAPIAWADHCNNFGQSLSQPNLHLSRSLTTRDAVFNYVSRLQQNCRTLVDKNALLRVEKLLSSMKPLAMAADLLADGSATPSTLLWGILGLSTKASTPRSEFVEVTLTAFETLLAAISISENYLKLLSSSSNLKVAVQEFFLVYLGLGRQCLKTFEGSFNFLSKTKWVRYNQGLFKDDISKIRKLSEVVHTEASVELGKLWHDRAEERHQEVVIAQQRQQEMLSVVTQNSRPSTVDSADRFVVPHPPNPTFTGRTTELLQMQRVLQGQHNELHGGQRVVAICGLGGVGKSQLALRYAYEFRTAYKACFWITCDSTVKMDGDLTIILGKLGFSSLGLDQNRERLKDWLSTADQNCLLIFDNAENPRELANFWPRSSTVSIILTSQNASWLLKENVNHAISLKSLTESESLELLNKIMAKHGCSIADEEAVTVVKETGGLPLAVRHMGTYLCAMGSDPAEFIKDYQDESQSSVIDAWDESVPSWYAHTLSTFLNVAYERLSDDAVSLLSTMIFLDPDGINEELFLQSDSQHQLLPKNRYTLAVRNCVQYDFLAKNSHNKISMLSMHRQVRAYLRHKCPPVQISQGFTWAFRRLRQVFPHQSAIAEPLSLQWAECATWIDHVIAITDGLQRFKNILEPSTEIAPLLVDGAIYLWERGLLDEGRHLTLAAKTIVERDVCDERILADVYGFHACILSESGDLQSAKEFFELQKDNRSKRLGFVKSTGQRDMIDEVQLANSYNNLAGVCCALGEYDDAQVYNELSLRIKRYWEASLDLRYLQSLSFQNIATLYGQTRRYDEAAANFQKAIELGENTKYTLRWALTYHNYGLMEAARGDNESAKALFEKAYELRQISLGDHYDTAATLHMLAGCYELSGDSASLIMARDLLVEALRILESKASSPDPRRIARSKFKLSIIMASLGDPSADTLRNEACRLVATVGERCTDEAGFDALVSYV